MPQAAIRWNGIAGPYDALQLGVAVTISNSDVGGETSWDFTLLKKPSGSSAVLAGSGNSRTMTPDVYGTYVVTVVVNSDPNMVDQSAGAVLTLGGLRVPAVGEENDWGAEGWAESLSDIYERSDHGYGAKPAASANYRRRTWFVEGGAGVADTFEICAKDAGDVYNWENLIGGGGGSVIRAGVDTVVELRAETGAVDKELIYLEGSDRLFRFQDTSMDADDGVTIIKPDEINPGDPGRWILGFLDLQTQVATNTGDIATNTAHSIGDGSDHANVAANSAAITTLQTDVLQGGITDDFSSQHPDWSVSETDGCTVTFDTVTPRLLLTKSGGVGASCGVSRGYFGLLPSSLIGYIEDLNPQNTTQLYFGFATGTQQIAATRFKDAGGAVSFGSFSFSPSAQDRTALANTALWVKITFYGSTFSIYENVTNDENTPPAHNEWVLWKSWKTSNVEMYAYQIWIIVNSGAGNNFQYSIKNLQLRLGQ